MDSNRIKELQEETAYPQSISVYKGLMQVWNECQEEHNENLRKHIFVYVVTERDNYGEQLFKGVFSTREKALQYLAEDGLKESNIDEINEIELD